MVSEKCLIQDAGTKRGLPVKKVLKTPSVY